MSDLQCGIYRKEFAKIYLIYFPTRMLLLLIWLMCEIENFGQIFCAVQSQWWIVALCDGGDSCCDVGGQYNGPAPIVIVDGTC